MQQIITRWPHTGEFFSKLTYAPEAYESDAKRDKTRKYGFATGRPLNRDDLSSTIEVGRFRAQLTTEARSGRNAEARLAAEVALLQATRGTRPRPVPTTGLASMLPKHQHAYDREREVKPFETRKIPLARKYERNYGSMRPTSSDIGEGCDDKSLLRAPEHGVGDFAGKFSSRFAHPTILGSMPYVQK